MMSAFRTLSKGLVNNLNFIFFPDKIPFPFKILDYNPYLSPNLGRGGVIPVIFPWSECPIVNSLAL